MTMTYIVTTTDNVHHTVVCDTPPTVVSGQGLTFTVGGVVQAPSPFPQWCSCAQQS